mgnify:FL=1
MNLRIVTALTTLLAFQVNDATYAKDVFWGDSADQEVRWTGGVIWFYHGFD